MKQSVLVFALFLLFHSPLTTQTPDSSMLTLDRIFNSAEFTLQKVEEVRWMDDGKSYTIVEPSKEIPTGKDIVRYDTKSGARSILVPAAKLIPVGKAAPLEINDYSWSADGSQMLLFTNTKRVWRQNTRGDYWVVNVKDWSMKKLGGGADSSTLMFAKFSPDGTKVAYVRANNLFIEEIATGRITALTNDGSTTVSNGTFDWVYEEEFDLRDGFRWSPDGTMIAYWQVNADSVRTFYLIDDTDSLYSFVKPIRYPKAGETNSACRVGVVDITGGPTRWMDVAGDQRNNYIARMEWAGNSAEIVMQHLNRQQNELQVMLGDAKTGRVRTAFTDRDSAWVDVVNDLLWLNGGKTFTYVSERDGWRHVYTVSRSGSDVRCITPWPFDVADVSRIDERGGWLYFIASPNNATQRYLYRSKLDGSGTPQRLSPANEPGTHSYNVSPDAHWALHTYSTFTTPPATELVSLPEHKSVRVMVNNTPLKQRLATIRTGATEFFRVNIGGGVQLDAWCMLPPGFDATKKYPVLFNVYGEPAGQTVLDRWGNELWHRYLTQQGYIVMSVDNRGTPAPRGRAWRRSIYRQIGILASEDQAAALKAILATRPYVDATRVAIWGWSGGGAMTLNMLFRYPDLYKTGMAVAAVTNERYYDSIYEERYMDLPQNNPDGYRNGSPITFARQLKGNLLMVHGTGDDNVHYQNMEAVVNELIKYNKPFTMMAYPNRTHGIYEGENTTRHLYELLTRFLKDNL